MYKINLVQMQADGSFKVTKLFEDLPKELESLVIGRSSASFFSEWSVDSEQAFTYSPEQRRLFARPDLTHISSFRSGGQGKFFMVHKYLQGESERYFRKVYHKGELVSFTGVNPNKYPVGYVQFSMNCPTIFIGKEGRETELKDVGEIHVPSWDETVHFAGALDDLPCLQLGSMDAHTRNIGYSLAGSGTY